MTDGSQALDESGAYFVILGETRLAEREPGRERRGGRFATPATVVRLRASP
jgi:hypothetical protein